MPDKTKPAPSPLPRSVEVLLETSKRLREEADKLEEQAKEIKRTIAERKK